jgi:molybdopterin converting factor small subunit
MLILINGREISALNGLDTILQEGDEVVFVPVVHGG